MVEIEEKDASRTLEEIAKTDAFLALYSKWLAARAVCEDPAQPDDAESEGRHYDAREEAARQLLVAPAPLPWAAWLKWEVFELALDSDYRTGIHNNARTVLALATIKADLMRFGFGT
jgi:hypothetical protein